MAARRVTFWPFPCILGFWLWAGLGADQRTHPDSDMGTYALLQDAHREQALKERPSTLPKMFQRDPGSKMEAKFLVSLSVRKSCTFGKGAREYEAPEELLGYNYILQGLAVYGASGKRAWVSTSPGCPVPHRATIHSGCLVSARIHTDVTFNSDTASTVPAPATRC